ncbi:MULTISPECIES: PhzF family phenazine biosynthesis protein [unclassified Motilimonas]|uniref:PhzF family phenazine biosynthesis protein n=1 Tax=unclassified Motilimonas TaxID=2643697 RepID=UPI001E5B6C9B|nr:MULTISPECIES: PhzF family phenazine biosynthesis protein [unclassified Motilimonas]MCE0555692.1 PhzF family phenazine biosynthesis protein [Motilimonas sp. E26]MDO6524258.1 PhzF family phenazine biosynthesis protein [Motilimonas sp. 1_MG-2023]
MLTLFQIDAFSDELFKGNPAAVVPLESWLSDELMQQIAAENNLAETAFFVPISQGQYQIRWFTPACEVPLCGHATLASAFVLFNEMGVNGEQVVFHSKSGELTVTKSGEQLQLNFPQIPAAMVADELIPADIELGLGVPVANVLEATNQDDPVYLVVLDSVQQLRALTPDMNILARLHPHSVLVTALGEEGSDYDCESRFFLPSYGIDEDPVTGMAHCILAPYWSRQLEKASINAYQASKRGGAMHCKLLAAGRVLLSGQGKKYLSGHIHL